MAKQSSILAHSKVTENRVCHYLWGDEHYRDWQERHDISGPAFNSPGKWLGEVKDYALSSLNNAGGLLGVAEKAYDQVEQLMNTEYLHFAWIHIKHGKLENDCVAFRYRGVGPLIFAKGRIFKEHFL